MRTPKRHVALDGTESWKVRFKVEGRDSSITFYEQGAATEFCILLDSYRGEPQRAIDWLNKREADLAARSEERRVGKGDRSQVVRDQEEEKRGTDGNRV